MKKSRLLGAVCACAISFASSETYAQSILFSTGGDGTWNRPGIHTNFINAINTATEGNVGTTYLFDNLSQMLSYDALWLDLRGQPSILLSDLEISNITAFADTGKKIVMVGEHSSWVGWNNQITGIGGGSTVFSPWNFNLQTPITSHELTQGVSRIDVPSGGYAVGGTPLFRGTLGNEQYQSVTLWGDNVLTILDSGIFSDRSWGSLDNSIFITNLANWIADSPPSPVPIPSALWLFSSGLLGLVGMARRKKA